jgi:hypothetical protein
MAFFMRSVCESMSVLIVSISSFYICCEVGASLVIVISFFRRLCVHNAFSTYSLSCFHSFWLQSLIFPVECSSLDEDGLHFLPLFFGAFSEEFCLEIHEIFEPFISRVFTENKILDDSPKVFKISLFSLIF